MIDKPLLGKVKHVSLRPKYEFLVANLMKYGLKQTCLVVNLVASYVTPSLLPGLHKRITAFYAFQLAASNQVAIFNLRL